MGNKTSSESQAGDDDFDSNSQDASVLGADSESQLETDMPHHMVRRNSSVANKDLAELFRQYKEVFLQFQDIDLVEKLTDDIQSNVYRGFYGNADFKREVLVKIPFNQRFTIPMAKKLAKQAVRYVHLRHDNIVHLLGFAISSEQIFVVSEYCAGGILLSTIQKKHHDLAPRKLGEWALDIAKGMHYLSSNHVIHGNLCAAICLLTDSELTKSRVKISDFIHPAEVGMAEFSVFPLRWVAPETIETGGGNTSQSGDVWSFGIVLWELFSGGKQPYPHIESNLVLQEFILHRNGVHEKPEQMPLDLYTILMVPCLNHSTGKRPTFENLVGILEVQVPKLAALPEKVTRQSSSLHVTFSNTVQKFP